MQCCRVMATHVHVCSELYHAVWATVCSGTECAHCCGVLYHRAPAAVTLTAVHATAPALAVDAAVYECCSAMSVHLAVCVLLLLLLLLYLACVPQADQSAALVV